MILMRIGWHPTWSHPPIRRTRGAPRPRPWAGPASPWNAIIPAGAKARETANWSLGIRPSANPCVPGRNSRTFTGASTSNTRPGGWESPAKMSRATGFVSARWNQAFISHVWSSGLPLTLDPATGVQSNRVVTTKYNDFDHLKWLGNQPVGRFPIHATEESGRWICVESRIQLNQPGQKDGYAALWVDGRLDTERRGLDFRGNYTGRGASVNAVFLEAYWNSGSPANQYRWYDDFVVSTAPIGPLTATVNPTLIRDDHRRRAMGGRSKYPAIRPEHSRFGLHKACRASPTGSRLPVGPAVSWDPVRDVRRWQPGPCISVEFARRTPLVNGPIGVAGISRFM